MAALSNKARKFQVYFLKFLAENPNPEVHIYNEVMNYWSNDSSDISLAEIKNSITDLCEKKFIVSKNNAHNSIGVHGISEEQQKNSTLCKIQVAGKAYLRKANLKKRAKVVILTILGIALLYLLWRIIKLSDLLR